MGVAEPAVPASAQGHALADLGQVGDERLAVLVEDLGALRHLQDDVGRIRASTVSPHAVDADAGLEMLLVAVIDEGIEPVGALDDDVAAAAAIAAVRPAELDELL